MNVRKSNPLNALYHLWVELGGRATPEAIDTKAETWPNAWQDNLCHFMRVVLIWVWFRWLFMRRMMFTYIKGGIYISPFLTGAAAFLTGAFTSLMVHYPEFRLAVFAVGGMIAGVIGLILIMEETRLGAWLKKNQEEGMLRRKVFWAPKKEAFDLFKDWLYAKKMRVCPQIKVDL